MFKLMLVRHGQTELNKHGIMQGQIDEPLNDTGRSQAMDLACFLKDEVYTHVFSSDLARASETCKLALSKNTSFQDAKSDIQIKLEPRLRERCYGSMEGKPFVEYLNAAKEAGIDRKSFTPEGAETRIQLLKRAEDFFMSLCESVYLNMSNGDENVTCKANVLAVGHGAYWRSLCELLRDTFGCIFNQSLQPVMANAGRTSLIVTLPSRKTADDVIFDTSETNSLDDWKNGITIKCLSLNIPVHSNL
uniref:Fructose-2,6-bisphosphatase TIGAR n=1 Tax=Phallusia mammillata TaxID=59560 RepID=A0A6F9D763_9ASCI|nr:fructose-2,6-bisphosphatase TIGAR-like [Phallusia mammillata]